MGNTAILDPKFQNHLGSHLNVFIWLRLVELDNQSHPPRKKKKIPRVDLHAWKFAVSIISGNGARLQNCFHIQINFCIVTILTAGIGFALQQNLTLLKLIFYLSIFCQCSTSSSILLPRNGTRPHARPGVPGLRDASGNAPSSCISCLPHFFLTLLLHIPSSLSLQPCKPLHLIAQLSNVPICHLPTESEFEG